MYDRRKMASRKGFPLYEVSDQGRVRSLSREFPRHVGKVLKHAVGRKGHHHVCLSNNGHAKTFSVHILVLEAFVCPRPEGLIGLHRDDDKTNNRVENLYWGTYSDNLHDSVRNGTHPAASKTACKRGHPLDGINATSGTRYCKTCAKARRRKTSYVKVEMPYGRPRLTDEMRAAIQADTRPLRAVAADYGISHTFVRRIRQSLF